MWGQLPPAVRPSEARQPRHGTKSTPQTPPFPPPVHAATAAWAQQSSALRARRVAPLRSLRAPPESQSRQSCRPDSRADCKLVETSLVVCRWSIVRSIPIRPSLTTSDQRLTTEKTLSVADDLLAANEVFARNFNL